MVKVLGQNNRKARKRRRCDGWEAIDMNGDREHRDEVTCSGVIEKDQVYVQQSVADGGRAYNFSSCQSCWNIMNKYELFGDD